MESAPSKEHNIPPPPYTAKAEPGWAYPQQPPPVGLAHYDNENQSTPAVTIVHALQLDDKSQMVHCSHCGTQSMTRIEAKPNTMTHTIALILCCFVCWPCAWLPYACDSCQSIHHYCSNCNAYLGEHRSH